MNENTHKIFWKIFIDTQGGQIRAFKEVSLWDISNSVFPRQKRWVRKPLGVEICIPEMDGDKFKREPESTRKVFVNADQIVFNGGFLRIIDDGLKNDLYEYEANIPNFDASSAIENVSSRTIVETTTLESEEDQISPTGQFMIDFIHSKLIVLFDQSQLERERCEAAIFLQTVVNQGFCLWLNKLFEVIVINMDVDPSPPPTIIRDRCADFLEAFDSLFLNKNWNLVRESIEINNFTELLDIISSTTWFEKNEPLSNAEWNEFVNLFVEFLEDCFSDTVTGEVTTIEVKNKNFYFKGENIRLEVEYETNDPSKDQAPLFYYDQGIGNQDSATVENGRITLSEIGSSVNQVNVELSGNNLTSKNSYSVLGNRVITFNEDKDRSGDEDLYFELFLDALPLVPENALADGIHEHWFDTERKVFYVGYIPSNLIGSINTDTYYGSIRRIVFDPNASCPGCVGGV